MLSSAELIRQLQRAGAVLVKEKGNHTVWRLGGETFRVSGGRRPNYIVRALTRGIRRAAQKGGV